MKKALLFSIILLLSFMLMACELLNNNGYYSSLEDALKSETSEGTIELLLDIPDKRMVAYLSKRNEKDAGDLTVVTYDVESGRYKRDIGRGETSIALGGDFGKSIPILMHYFIHPDTGDKYLYGMISKEDVQKVKIKFIISKQADEIVETIIAQVENNNLFFINDNDDLFDNAVRVEYELVDENGEIAEEFYLETNNQPFELTGALPE